LRAIGLAGPNRIGFYALLNPEQWLMNVASPSLENERALLR
jgi:hypothetical protein